MKIKTDEIMEFLGCDEPFLMHLLGKFLEEAGEGVTRLRIATDLRNWPLVKAVAHKMLSSTRIFNFSDLSTLIEEIETSAEREFNTQQISGKVSVVEKQWEVIAAEIKSLLITTKS